MKLTTITRIIILATALAWIGWDVYAYIHGGVQATESYTFYELSFHYPGIAFLGGLLCGHLFFPQAQVIRDIIASNKS